MTDPESESTTTPDPAGQYPDAVRVEARPDVVSAQKDQASHAISRRIFETSLDLILVVDRRGTIVQVSPSSRTILGYDPDEMIGCPATRFLWYEDIENTRGEMLQARAGGVTRHFECRYVHKDGRVMTLIWTGVWSEPEQQHFFIGRDITDVKETQRRLYRSEQRFHDIAEVSGDWIWETDQAHRFTLLYGGSADSSPIRPDSLLGLTRWQAAGADPETDEAWRRHKADLDARRPFRQFRYEIATQAGGRMFVSASGKPVFSETGAFAGYRGTATDETSTVEARRRAEQAEALLWDAIENISEGLAIYDDQDRLVLCNESYWNLFARRAPRFIQGIRLEDLLRDALARGQYTEAVGREEEWIAERLREHRDAAGASEHRMRDGRWVMVTKRRMSNGWVAVLRIDITALKSAQAALRESEGRLNRAQRIAHMGSFVRDLVTDAAEWSDEMYQIFGVPRDAGEPSFADFMGLIHPDDRAKLREIRDHLDQETTPEPIEFRILRSDGAVRHLYRETEVIRDRDGKPRAMAGTLHDITERRRIEDQLRQAQKMEAIGQLTGGMAHDFNNILGVVVGYLELAGVNVEGNEAATAAIGEARAAAMSAAELTTRLLAFARQRTLEPRVINLDDLVSGMIGLLRRTLGENITITVLPSAGTWNAVADPALVEDAILNLAINARDAMPDGGSLTIEIGNVVLDELYARNNAEVVPGEYAMLAITDSGTGMPPEVLERVFEPFFTTKEVGAGSGLGLSMVYGTARQSGGHLKIYSEVGYGTTVRLYLPRAQGEAGATAGEAPPAEVPLSIGTETILVVEDNVAMRQVACQMLAGLGYRVLQADTGAAALGVIESDETIDLLFTDIVMPGGLTGRQLAEEARTRRPDLPVLFTSGYAGNGNSNVAPAAEAISVIAKPYRRQDLATRVRDALSGAGRR